MPLAGAGELMQQQIGCIKQNGCRDLAQIPDSVFGGHTQQPTVTQTGPASTPTTGSTPSPAIVIEGNPSGTAAGEAPKATREPKATRVPKERKKDRGQQGEAQG